MKPTLRNLNFKSKMATNICYEKATTYNPYICKKMYWHGYDVQDLMSKCSYIEVMFLVFNGELPNKLESTVFNALLIASCNPGPRHPATRAGMTAGISKTEAVSILPQVLSVMSGEMLGAKEVENAARFIRKVSGEDADTVAQRLLDDVSENDDRIAPGFGSIYGGIDQYANKIAESLLKIKKSKNMVWCTNFVRRIEDKNYSWLMPGVVAACLLDLGFQSKVCGAIYQMISAPGLLAHALEGLDSDLSNIPWIDDEHYIIEE